MTICSNCGAENPDASRFCGNCGQALEAATEQQAAGTEQTPPVEQPPPAAPPPAAPPPAAPPAQDGTTAQQAAYEEALAAINPPAPSTDPTEPHPPATVPVAEPATAIVAPPPQPPDMFAPAGEPVPAGGGSNKKVLAIVGGAIALLAIVGALVFFFFIRDDDEPEPAAATEVEAPEETDAGDVPAEGEAPGEAAAGGEVLFDSIEPLIAQQAGPYSVTQSSSDPCEPPCIFPPDAHSGSVETMQVTWDAGDPTSQIYGEFLLYGTVEDAQFGFEATAAELEATGYQAVDTFTIDGVPGTTYQSVDDEILLWSTSNIMMGLAGNKGFPTELVGYLGP